MIDFISRIKGSSSFIRESLPKGFRPDTALVFNRSFTLPDGLKIAEEVKYSDIPHFEITAGSKTGSVLFCKTAGRDVIVYHGRLHYYDGVSMRSIAHKIYVLKFLGIKRLISVDEVGHLNPRFKCGELALIYDHINLMGDNPLIGKNEDALGVRFPDMSNAYDSKLFDVMSDVLMSEKMKCNESVMIGITGPNSETDAEARFYREAGADVLGYSMIPENITAVHAGLKFGGIGLITRELVADKMMEERRTESELELHRKKSLARAGTKLGTILQGIIKSL